MMDLKTPWTSTIEGDTGTRHSIRGEIIDCENQYVLSMSWPKEIQRYQLNARRDEVIRRINAYGPLVSACKAVVDWNNMGTDDERGTGLYFMEHIMPQIVAAIPEDTPS